MNHRRLGPLRSAMIVGIALTFAATISFAAPNTGSGPQKTDKQCKDERAKCLKDCDQIIDLGDAIKRCKDRCTDAYIMCTPLRVQPGGKLQGVRPQLVPQQNAPIMRRGTEGEQPGEMQPGPPPTPKEPTGVK
ncbi:MAG: hypothetical protein QM771_10815 [Nitrospira sp.]